MKAAVETKMSKPARRRGFQAATDIDKVNLPSIVSNVLTASQTGLFDVECAFPVRSKVAAFAVVAKVAVAGKHLTRSILWLNGEQCERK